MMLDDFKDEVDSFCLRLYSCHTFLQNITKFVGWFFLLPVVMSAFGALEYVAYSVIPATIYIYLLIPIPKSAAQTESIDKCTCSHLFGFWPLKSKQSILAAPHHGFRMSTTSRVSQRVSFTFPPQTDLQIISIMFRGLRK